MEWTRCYTYDRPGEDPQSDPNRSTFERDWDRLIFSSAFRRLQNKTQVFPLPNEVFVHNRLTHSLEVASVGRSLGSMVGEQLVREEPEIADHETSRDFYLNHLKTVIAAACLAHDLGNPAFGHSGEDAISSFFQQNQDKLYANKPLTKYYSKAEWKDLIRYEGNANAIRVLTKPKAELEHGEFQLCYTTLAAILKYPCTSGLNDKKLLHRKKYGVFQSERHILQAVAERTGMQPDGGSGKQLAYRRHPFVYLVEAADDICYSIIDLEDAHKLGILSYAECRELLQPLCLLDEATTEAHLAQRLAQFRDDHNAQIGYLRAKAINGLAKATVRQFIAHRRSILAGTFTHSLVDALNAELEQNGRPNVLKEVKNISVQRIYNHSSVVRIELSGYRIFHGLLDVFLESTLLLGAGKGLSSYQEKAFGLIPSQFGIQETQSPYEKTLRLLDFLSGMTDPFALKLYRNLNGIETPGVHA